MEDGTSKVMASAGEVAGCDFEAKVGHLNILPSRQNVLWPKLSEEACLGCATAEILPRGPMSLDASVGKTRASSTMSFPDEALASHGMQNPLLAQDKSDVSSSTNDQDTLNTYEAVFNLANTVLGVGVLSVPYAFRLSGYSSLLLVLVVIAVTSCTARFIGSALDLAARSPAFLNVPPKGRDFTFLAHVAFGGWVQALIGTITSLEIWFALITFMVMNGVNASLVWPGLDRSTAIVVSSFLAMLAVFLPMRYYSYLSLVSSLALAIAALAMVAAALTMPSWANPYDHLGLPALLQLQNLPRSVGIIVFCFAGHPCFPVVHECMRVKSSWNCSVSVTFFLAFVYYGGLGVFGYLVFGSDLTATFTENLAQLEGTILLRSASAAAFLVKIQLTAPLLLNAILVSVWAPEVGKPEWPLSRLLALAVLTAATAIMAVFFAHDVAAVAALTGSLFTMTTSVLFPAVVHLRLRQLYGPAHSCSLWAGLPHILVLIFGISMAILGTFLTISDMLS